MSKQSLIKTLIHFHWKNIVKDNARIGTKEVKKRTEVIRKLKTKIAQPQQYQVTRKNENLLF